MSKKEILRSITDLAMAVLLPMLMAYSLIGEEVHEWIGVAMLCLVLIHQILNLRWYRALSHGKYNAVRILNTALNFILLADILLTGISGMLISSYVFSFLNISIGTSVFRQVHLSCSYWALLLMSFHLGMNWHAVLSRLNLRGKSKRILIAIADCIALCGLFMFFRLNFPEYLFLRESFVFFDFEKSPAIYLFEMVSVMTFFALLGFYCVKFLMRRKRGEAL